MNLCSAANRVCGPYLCPGFSGCEGREGRPGGQRREGEATQGRDIWRFVAEVQPPIHADVVSAATSRLLQGDRGGQGRRGLKGQKGEQGPPGLDQPCPVVGRRSSQARVNQSASPVHHSSTF